MTPTPDLLEALQANLAILREVGLRYNAAAGGNRTSDTAMRGPDEVDELCADMKDLVQEQVRVLLLNTKHEVLDVVTVYQGTVNSASIRIAEVLRPAVIANVPHIIVVHNHPSGDTEPSHADLLVTRKLHQSANLMDINLLDHVVVARGAAPCSMARRGLAGLSS